MSDAFAAPRPSPFTEDTPLGVVAIWEGKPGGKLWGLMTPEQFAEFKRRLAEEGL